MAAVHAFLVGRLVVPALLVSLSAGLVVPASHAVLVSLVGRLVSLASLAVVVFLVVCVVSLAVLVSPAAAPFLAVPAIGGGVNLTAAENVRAAMEPPPHLDLVPLSTISSHHAKLETCRLNRFLNEICDGISSADHVCIFMYEHIKLNRGVVLTRSIFMYSYSKQLQNFKGK